MARRTHHDARGFSAPLAILVCLVCALVAVAVCVGLRVITLPGQGPVQIESEATSSIPVVKDSEFREVSVDITMVGDILVHRRVWESGQRSDGTYDFNHLFANVADDLSSADLTLVNQETILGGTQLGLSGYPSFNSPQEVGDAEAAVGVDVALAATNHALDQGQTGINNELSFWETNHPEVTCLGISTDEAGYDSVYIYEKDGFKIAVLNYATDTNGIPLPANNPYAVRMLTTEKVTADVAAARAQGADAIVVCPHWGTEYSPTADDAQRAWAQTFLDLGVDVVLGTHPHVLEPVEVMTGADGHRMVVYWSLGNFISTQDKGNQIVGGMAKVTLTKASGSTNVTAASLVPVVTQEASGDGMTTYRLADYTQQLASTNWVTTQTDSRFSRQFAVDLCQDVLGAGFDPQTCLYTVAL